MIQLDQNAGLPISEEAIQQYLLYTQYNNIYGFGDQKMQLQKEVEEKRQWLCKAFGFDRVIYTSGATQSIRDIFTRIQNIKVFGGQHPSVTKLEALIQREDGVCLICLVNSATSEIQLPTQEQIDKFPYIVLDVSQAIGKGKFGPSQMKLPKQGEKNIHCMFFSNHKLGGVKGSGFIVCSSEFYNRYMVKINQIYEKKQEKERQQLHQDLQQNGSFDICGFMSSVYLLESLQIPSKKEMYESFVSLRAILQKCSKVKNIKPEIEKINNINDYPNCFSSLTFELEGMCPRSFQHVLENKGVQIGFETACQSGQTGVLRMSWRNPVKQINIIEKYFNETIQYLESKEKLSGGKKLNTSFLQQINANKFWLVHHFAPSHDLEPNIDVKYEIMFQPDLLKQFTTISLKIPPHHETHRIELDIKKKKENNEDFDGQQDGIRIQKRRLSKYLWINNPDAEYELSLEDFEKEKIIIPLSNQVFRSVSDNLVFKKQLPKEFESDVNEYEIEIKKYPETLLQEITVKHPNPEKAPPKQVRHDKPKQKKTKIESNGSDSNDNEESDGSEDDGSKNDEDESNESDGDGSGDELEGGRKDPDYIREEIKFLITSYNLRLLTFLGGNNLSVAILTNLDKLYRRGEKPSKYANPHQCIVQDLDYILFQNCFGTVLTSMRLMKEIDSNYPQFMQQTTQGISIISQRNNETKFIKPVSKFYSEQDLQFSTKEVEDKIIIQQLNNPNIDKIKEFLSKNKPKKIVIYLPNINTDEIEEDYGLYYYFKQNEFKYEIDFIRYYDVWTHQYLQDKQIVKFYK